MDNEPNLVGDPDAGSDGAPTFAPHIRQPQRQENADEIVTAKMYGAWYIAMKIRKVNL